MSNRFTDTQIPLTEQTKICAQTLDAKGHINLGQIHGFLNLGSAAQANTEDFAPAGSYIVEGDTRLTNSRSASDVYTWAKNPTKPAYTPAEVGAPSGSGSSTGNNTGDETTASLLTTLGIPTHADMTAANLALEIGKPFYNTALTKLDITTA